MFPAAHAQFDKMDQLSQQQIPFFYIIDFEVENIEIFREDELLFSGLMIDFEYIKTPKPRLDLARNFKFKSNPAILEDYEKGFQHIQKHLKEGYSYLANYTCSTEIETNLSAEEIFARAEAKYKVFYPGKFVFFSPETFVETDGNKIKTHPMKGTIDAAVENGAELLRKDPKEQAEHYTVVDLLRNDLSMVAERVCVDEFQRVDLIRTNKKNLYAMSSEISGTLKPEFRGKVGSIMRTLSPAGSILGAPKKKTLEIILEAENHKRGFYTGVCGYFDGKNLDSCVMIRFIELQDEKMFFKSGGGITHLSKLADEYEEMKNKIYVPIY